MTTPSSPRYALLEEILSLRNLHLQATFSIRDVATIFGVSPRAIQNRVASGQLPVRDLPGRAKFLPQDLEEFLLASKRPRLRGGL